MKRIKLKDRILPKYTKGEEIFNMTSHIVGGGLGIVALVLCVIFAAIHHNPYGVVSSAIFGVTMILLYTMSSIYHGLSPKLNPGIFRASFAFIPQSHQGLGIPTGFSASQPEKIIEQQVIRFIKNNFFIKTY